MHDGAIDKLPQTTIQGSSWFHVSSENLVLWEMKYVLLTIASGSEGLQLCGARVVVCHTEAAALVASQQSRVKGGVAGK